jgi:hypothetical protein
VKYPYEYRPNNPKIDIFVFDTYNCSTAWARTCKDAVEGFIARHPQFEGAKVVAKIDHR